MSVCRPCTIRTHFRCEYPASCGCAHKRTWPDGTADEWTYTAIPVVFDNGTHGWVWRAVHPDSEEVLFDRMGRRCELRFGDRGVRLFYRAVDFGIRL